MGDDPGKGATVPEETPFPLTEIDRFVLSQTDDEFKKHDWEDLTKSIGGQPCQLLSQSAAMERDRMKGS